MKKTINIITLTVGLSFFFTGCYTIVWDPREEYPDTETYSESTEFYQTDYFGGYGSYYETPWWISSPVFVTYPGGTDQSITKDRNNGRNSDSENIRNSGGRGNTDRNPIITNPTPTTSSTTTTTSSGDSNNSNVKRNSNSSNSGKTNSSTSTTKSSNNSNTRNSSGSRNSGSGRK